MQVLTTTTHPLERTESANRGSDIRVESVAASPAVTQWLAQRLRPENPDRLILEYPQVFGPRSRALFVTERARKQHPGQPIAHATLLPIRIRLGVAALDAALISHVYTEPERRGCGHASRILEAAHCAARELGLGIALLWSEAPELYDRAGYAPFGQERLIHLGLDLVQRARSIAASAAGDTAAERYEIGSPSEADWCGIARLRDRRSSGAVLDREILRASASIPELETRVARRNGQTVAFAMLGRGDDFRGVVHEWGGATEETLACIEALISAPDAPIPPDGAAFLLSPATPAEIPWLLRRAGAALVSQPLARMRILDFEVFSRQIRECAPELSTESTGCFDAFRDREKDLLALLFGSTESLPTPHAPTAEAAQLPETSCLSRNAQQKLPLPLFLWGLESI